MLSKHSDEHLEESGDGGGSPWNPDDWGGLTEAEAFEENSFEVLLERGEQIASQTWRSGSFSSVYEYKGRFYALDEAGMEDYDNVSDAFSRANIGSGEHDELMDTDVAPAYQYLVTDETGDVLAHINREAKLAFDYSSEFWGEEPGMNIVGRVISSSGDEGTLAFRFIGFDLAPGRWDGLFRTRSIYENWVRKQGFMVSMSDFQALPSSEVMKQWRLFERG